MYNSTFVSFVVYVSPHEPQTNGNTEVDTFVSFVVYVAPNPHKPQMNISTEKKS